MVLTLSFKRKLVAIATLLCRQNPIASLCSAWCPGGLTIAKTEFNSPFATLSATYLTKSLTALFKNNNWNKNIIPKLCLFQPKMLISRKCTHFPENIFLCVIVTLKNELETFLVWNLWGSRKTFSAILSLFSADSHFSGVPNTRKCRKWKTFSTELLTLKLNC